MHVCFGPGKRRKPVWSPFCDSLCPNRHIKYNSHKQTDTHLNIPINAKFPIIKFYQWESVKCCFLPHVYICWNTRCTVSCTCICCFGNIYGNKRVSQKIEIGIRPKRFHATVKGNVKVIALLAWQQLDWSTSMQS